MFITGADINYGVGSNYKNREIEVYCRLEGLSLSEIREKGSSEVGKDFGLFKRTYIFIKNLLEK